MYKETWTKTINGVDKSQNGGYSLIGNFTNEYSRDGLYLTKFDGDMDDKYVLFKIENGKRIVLQEEVVEPKTSWAKLFWDKIEEVNPASKVDLLTNEARNLSAKEMIDLMDNIALLYCKRTGAGRAYRRVNVENEVEKLLKKLGKEWGEFNYGDHMEIVRAACVMTEKSNPADIKKKGHIDVEDWEFINRTRYEEYDLLWDLDGDTFHYLVLNDKIVLN